MRAVVSIRWPCQLVILSSRSGRLRARPLFVPALDEHRAAMLSDKMQRRRNGIFLEARRLSSGRLGVAIVATSISRRTPKPWHRLQDAAARRTMTGSKTTGMPG